MMTRSIDRTVPAAAPGRTELHRVFEAARRFVAYRALAARAAEQRAAAAAAEQAGGCLTLAAAIERDFLAFDLTRAEQELRAAVLAIDPEPVADPLPDDPAVPSCRGGRAT